MALGPALPRSFFARDAREVAAELIGCRLVHRLSSDTRLVVRLTEVEAYRGQGQDPASHAHRGPTPRNRSMFGAPGRLYAYRSYGVHTCANVVCEAEGQGAAVLLRAAEPLEGLERMTTLRGLAPNASPRLLTVGPGRLAQALGLTLDHDGRSLLRGPLTLRGREPSCAPPQIERSPRVGISRATEVLDRHFEANPPGPSPWVSRFRAGGGRRR